MSLWSHPNTVFLGIWSLLLNCFLHGCGSPYAPSCHQRSLHFHLSESTFIVISSKASFTRRQVSRKGLWLYPRSQPQLTSFLFREHDYMLLPRCLVVVMATAIDLYLTSCPDPIPWSLVLKVTILHGLNKDSFLSYTWAACYNSCHWWSPGSTVPLINQFLPPNQKEPTHWAIPSEFSCTLTQD